MRHGFSLVELSIVLVILGLLTGGILAGQSLIRAAEIRAVTAEYARYATARNSFRDKYFGLPGDITNATAFWGAADGGTGSSATCFSTASTDEKTCNGDGDGKLQKDATTRSSENYRYWQQLANAGLIEGHYTGAPNGTYSTNNRYAVSGVNIPASKLSGAAWYTEWVGSSDGSGWAWAGYYGSPFYFGAVEPTDIPEAAILKPEEAWNIDTKLDDGHPSTGVVRDYQHGTSCASDASVASAAYLLDSSDIGCHLVFIPGS